MLDEVKCVWGEGGAEERMMRWRCWSERERWEEMSEASAVEELEEEGEGGSVSDAGMSGICPATKSRPPVCSGSRQRLYARKDGEGERGEKGAP